MNARKATLVLAALLLLAAPVFAQDAPNTAPQAFYDESNNFYGPDNNLYPPSSVTYFLPANESSQQSGDLTAAVNDSKFVPSTMMNYEDAVALGYQQLQQMRASQKAASPSLGEAARQVRVQAAPGQNPSVSVQQDASGSMAICDAQGNQCRPFS